MLRGFGFFDYSDVAGAPEERRSRFFNRIWRTFLPVANNNIRNVGANRQPIDTFVEGGNNQFLYENKADQQVANNSVSVINEYDVIN